MLHIRRPRHLQLRALVAGVSLGTASHSASARELDVRLVGYFFSNATDPMNDNR